MFKIAKTLMMTIAAVAAFSGSAYAADLGGRTYPTVLAAPEPASFVWTGFYLGVDAGYGSGTNSFDNNYSAPVLHDTASFGTGGWTLGGTAGADWQVSQSIVVGVLADIYWSGISGSGVKTDLFAIGGNNVAVSTQQNWGYDILARAGFLATDRMLIYGLGGFSGVNQNWSMTNAANTTYTGSDDLQGWTAGLGLETMLTKNVSLKGEYRYTQFNDVNYSFDGGNGVARNSPSENRFLLGLNIRFGGY